MKADGSGARRVTAPPLTIHFYADCSPDGQQIVFVGDCNDTGGGHLCLVNGDGSGARMLVAGVGDHQKSRSAITRTRAELRLWRSS